MEISHVYQKLWLDDVWFLRYGALLADGQMDRLTDGKSDIWRWVSHLKIKHMWRMWGTTQSFFLAATDEL